MLKKSCEDVGANGNKDYSFKINVINQAYDNSTAGNDTVSQHQWPGVDPQLGWPCRLWCYSGLWNCMIKSFRCTQSNYVKVTQSNHVDPMYADELSKFNEQSARDLRLGQRFTLQLNNACESRTMVKKIVRF